VIEDFEGCYRALQARDPRFDGWFYVAVSTTRIYCRPSCPARTPGRDRVRFYPSAAAAQQAGYRACLRCRPDAVPGSPEWNARADVVGRALRLMSDGVVDREGVDGLARRLHYGDRHLHRLLVAEVGAGPLALARAQRAQAARVLIETTALPMADVAFAAGFSSVRQFNDTVRDALGRTPSELRSAARGRAGRRGAPPSGARARDGAGATSVTLRLPFRRPMAVEALFAFLGARAVPGLEHDGGDTFGRTLRLPHGHGTVAVAKEDGAGDPRRSGHLHARLELQDLRDLGAAVGRCRRLLDLDADPEAVDAALREDVRLRPLVDRTPGLRIPGAVDGFELAVRAVVGQQVSVRAARSVVTRLVADAGPALALSDRGRAAHLGRVFPTAAELRAAPDDAFAVPRARRTALRALAAAVADGRLSLDPGADPLDARARLMELPGIGAWTAGYVALRAFGDPDVFLTTDLGVARGLGRLGLPGDAPHALAAAEAWRPWRSYAMGHLWREDAPGPDGGRGRGVPAGGSARGDDRGVEGERRGRAARDGGVRTDGNDEGRARQPRHSRKETAA
jgi:AraC family transcriptional regulator of adaptative response / DNA-3-methyladenine glycosylase II